LKKIHIYPIFGHDANWRHQPFTDPKSGKKQYLFKWTHTTYIM